MDDDNGIEVASITITRRFHPERDRNDSDAINVSYSDQLTLVEVLGLLEFAKLSASADMILDHDDEG